MATILHIGPSGVRALPLAAGINVGGHYFRYFSTLVELIPVWCEIMRKTNNYSCIVVSDILSSIIFTAFTTTILLGWELQSLSTNCE